MDTVMDIVFNIDEYLSIVASEYGVYAYIIIFLVIFCETGLIVTPFLPGDSLVFLTGMLAGKGDLNLLTLLIIVPTAAILGDSVNYEIGKLLRDKVNNKEKIAFIKQEYLDKTHEFFEKHGGKTIILARFVPIIRTFAPFVSGVAKMSYKKFIIYNIIGGLIWAFSFILSGYFLGEIPFVVQNFNFILIGILIASVIPIMILFVKKALKR